MLLWMKQTVFEVLFADNFYPIGAANFKSSKTGFILQSEENSRRSQ